MLIHILSDLHLEFSPFQLPGVACDIVVIAGDAHTGKNGLKWIRETCARKPVIYVLGNHEFYGHTIPKLTKELKELTKGTNIYLLENESVVIGDVAFCGATLWTDFCLFGDPVIPEVAAQTGMSDYKRIRIYPKYRRLRTSDTRSLHADSLKWFQEQNEKFAGQKLVFVTHHAPSIRSVPTRFGRDPLTPAYASDLDSFLVGCNAQLWVHGHIHHFSDYTIGRTRVIANPRGYPDELQHGFNPELVIDL